MSGFSLQDKVKALNLGLTLAADAGTGTVVVTGDWQRFVFADIEQANQALDLAGYVALNAIQKFGRPGI